MIRVSEGESLSASGHIDLGGSDGYADGGTSAFVPLSQGSSSAKKVNLLFDMAENKYSFLFPYHSSTVVIEVSGKPSYKREYFIGYEDSRRLWGYPSNSDYNIYYSNGGQWYNLGTLENVKSWLCPDCW